jgi:hypothetical protein
MKHHNYCKSKKSGKTRYRKGRAKNGIAVNSLSTSSEIQEDGR